MGSSQAQSPPAAEGTEPPPPDGPQIHRPGVMRPGSGGGAGGQAPPGFNPRAVAAWLRKKSREVEVDFAGDTTDRIDGVGYGLRMAARLIEAGAVPEPLPAEQPAPRSPIGCCGPGLACDHLREDCECCPCGGDSPQYSGPMCERCADAGCGKQSSGPCLALKAHVQAALADAKPRAAAFSAKPTREVLDMQLDAKVEQPAPTKEELADSFVEHMRPLMVTEAGKRLMAEQPAPTKGYCSRCKENVVIDGHECPPWRGVCACNDGDQVFHTHYREEPHACARCSRCKAFQPEARPVPPARAEQPSPIDSPEIMAGAWDAFDRACEGTSPICKRCMDRRTANPSGICTACNLMRTTRAAPDDGRLSERMRHQCSPRGLLAYEVKAFADDVAALEARLETALTHATRAERLTQTDPLPPFEGRRLP